MHTALRVLVAVHAVLLLGTFPALSEPGDLYQLHQDGLLWKYTGTPCGGGSCPGWKLIEDSGNIWYIHATRGKVYALKKDHSVWEYLDTSSGCGSAGCPGWQRLDANTATGYIVAGGGKLYQFHGNGLIWEYTGTPCGSVGCPGWKQIANDQLTVQLTAGTGALYKLTSSPATIWRFAGERWEMIDNNPSIVRILASGQALFRIHNNGLASKFTGALCSGDNCPGWQASDTFGIKQETAGRNSRLNNTTVLYVIAGRQVIEIVGLRQMLFTDVPLDTDSRQVAIRAGGSRLYKKYSNGEIWQHDDKGEFGCSFSSSTCNDWVLLDANSATAAIYVDQE
jgi:hypothetical protein